MKIEDKQKVENYENNRHMVTVKKDMFGNWYFVDANGNKAKTIDGSGQLTETKHSRKEKMPTLEVSQIETTEDRHGATVTKNIYFSHLNDFPLISTEEPVSLYATNYTVDMYEALYQRQRLIASIIETKTIIAGKMNLKNLKSNTNRLEGLSMFNNFLKTIQPYLAVYFSKNEYPYLREFLKQTILDIVPESIIKSVKINTLLDNYFDELSQKRDLVLNSENEDVKYAGKVAESVAKNTGSEFAFGFTFVERVNESQQNEKHK